MSLLPSTPATLFHEQTAEADRFLPEGPRPIVVDGRPALAWVNIQTAENATAGDIHVRYWDTGEHRVFPQVKRPGFFIPTDRPNTLFVGREKEVGTLDLSTNVWTPLATISDRNTRTIINDGEVVPGGRAVVFGTKDVRFEDTIADLYLFTLDDNRVSVLAPKQMCSNGKVFARTAEGLLLYDIDTPSRRVTRYRLDIATRQVSDSKTAIDLRAAAGFPDGMVDVGDGSVIVAFYNPTSTGLGKAVRYSLETGTAVEEWTTPGSPRVTCPLLVERDGRVVLILTTASEGMPPEMRKRCPNAGNLFVAETTLKSLPVAEHVRLG